MKSPFRFYTPVTYHAPRKTGLQYVSESFDGRGVAGLGQEGGQVTAVGAGQ
jgi:hypothetical protein